MTRGVVANVVTNAITTKMVKVRVVSSFACRPILRTISSTNPLQLIKVPIVKLSLHNILLARAARVPPINLPKKAQAMTPTTYAQVMPLSRRPILVFSPDNAK